MARCPKDATVVRGASVLHFARRALPASVRVADSDLWNQRRGVGGPEFHQLESGAKRCIRIIRTPAVARKRSTAALTFRFAIANQRAILAERHRQRWSPGASFGPQTPRPDARRTENMHTT